MRPVSPAHNQLVPVPCLETPGAVQQGSLIPQCAFKNGLYFSEWLGFTATLNGQDREFLCIPPPPHRGFSEGCHTLHQDTTVSGRQ